MQTWLNILLDGMSRAVDWCKTIEIFSGVSLWSFCISVLLVGVILNVLVNVVRKTNEIGDAGMRRKYYSHKKGD